MLKNFILVIFSLFISLGSLEFFLRLGEVYQYKNSIYEQYKSVYSDERNKSYLFGHKSNVDVVLGDGETYFRFVTNNDGLREFNSYNSLDSSVVFLGDSIIEGSAVDNQGTIDSVFEDNTGVVGINMGLGSSNTVQQYSYLKSKYKKSFNSNLLVLGICLNDIKQNYYLRYFDSDVGNWKKYSDYQRLELDFASRNVTYGGYLIDQVKSFLIRFKVVQFIYYTLYPVRSGELYLADDYSQHDIDNTIASVKDIAEFARIQNMGFVVTVFPTRAQVKGQLTGKGVQNLLFSELSKNGIETISLDVLLQNATDTYGVESIWHDNVHPSPMGYQLIGDYLSSNAKVIRMMNRK